ncbi:MAG: YceI family protein [Coriobacteriia bacterium]
MERWRLDPAFSAVSFTIPRMGSVSPKGRFRKIAGYFETEDGAWLTASVEIRIEVASLSTGDATAEAEAVSARFLNAAEYPDIIFESHAVESVEDDHIVVSGDLTMRGITRPIRIAVDFVGRARDLDGTDRMSWEMSASVSRSDYGLEWHPALENVAGFIIGDAINITGEVEFVRQA